MSGITFTALDFETATSQRASVCEVGLAFVENGEIGMSGKQKKAMEMIAKGAPLQVLSEAEFMMMIGV